MEMYILSAQDLRIVSIRKPSSYEINLDEETNAKSTFILEKCDGLKKGNFIVVNGLYRQFLFVIDDVQSGKVSNIATVIALDISNIFDRKVIEKDTETMTTNSIEEFIANMISENFVNTEDTYIAINYIDIYWHTNTKAIVNTNSENGLYNAHTFIINCRQSKNICTDFKFEDGRLKIDIEQKEETAKLIDTTVAEITEYNKVHETDVTAKVQVLIREDNSIYNLYLKTDRTTTENKNDANRAIGRIETISVDTADKAREEALNVFKGNSYKHLVEFKIAKTSKLMDITQFYIGRMVQIKTNDDIYESYISAIRLTDENFVYFKSGNLRVELLDKLKKKTEGIGNKLDLSGGTIKGDLNIEGQVIVNNIEVEGEIKKSGNSIFLLMHPVGSIYMSVNNTNPSVLFGGTWVAWGSGRVPVGVNASESEFNTVEKTGGAKTHNLTINEMPNHEHDVVDSIGNTPGTCWGPNDWNQNKISYSGSNDLGRNLITTSVGGGQAHNNLQPYITCYMWKRTA